jgi:hypothetical protein
MQIKYLCPHCKGAINTKRNIILSAESKEDRSKRGLVLLHEEIGNYTVAMTGTIDLNPGDVVDFFCPVCHASINTPLGENMANLIRVEPNGDESNIVISRVFGERCTFQIDDRKKIKYYGDSMGKFIDPDWLSV